MFRRDNGLLPEETLDADAWEQLAVDVAGNRVDREEAAAAPLRQLL